MRAGSDPTSATNLQEQFGRIELRVRERRLHVDGRLVALGSRAFDLLAALVARRDRVVPKDELIDLVWPGLVVEDNNLQVQISALRKVLGPQAITTVPGRGYRFAVAAASMGPSFEAGSALQGNAHDGAPTRAATRPSRLLVVDDNRLNRLLLCRSLELMGHEVDTAVNGREALETLRSERVDLLLLDLQMPEVDGFELLALRSADPVLREIPVIATSALEGSAHVARCIALGADDYLQKPPDPVLLEARVKASLERKHLRDRERELLARLLPLGHPHAGASRQVEATVLYARLEDIDALGDGLADAATRTLELPSRAQSFIDARLHAHQDLHERVQPDIPAARQASRSARIALAVIATIHGRRPACDDDTMRRLASRPSTSGICMSISTTS